MKIKHMELLSSVLFLGLFLPMFASSKQLVGIFTIHGCFTYCQDPSGILAILIFLAGWLVLVVDAARVHLILYQKKDDRKVLGQMFFVCMLLLFFRMQNTERLYFGNTVPFVGWWLLVIGIVWKMRLRAPQGDKKIIKEIKKLLLFATVILIVSMPFWKTTIYPWYEEDAEAILARIGLGGMFLNDITAGGYMKRYVVYPLRQWVFVLVIAVLLFALLWRQGRRCIVDGNSRLYYSVKE